MNKYAALLRGIGPGNPNMTSAAFKSCFEEIGMSYVQTVLASGNVVFESENNNPEDIAEIIEKALPEKLGFSRSVIIRSQAELQKLIDMRPFKGIEDTHNKALYLLITFFRHSPTVSMKFPYRPTGKPYQLLGRIDNAVYGSVDLTFTKTPDYMAWLEKQFGKDITSRTPKTIERIVAKMG